MVEYTDFIVFLIPAVFMQVWALAYLARVRSKLGKKTQSGKSAIELFGLTNQIRLYGITNTLVLIYDFIMAYILAYAMSRPGLQQVEVWGLYLIIIFPIGMGIANTLKQRNFYKITTRVMLPTD